MAIRYAGDVEITLSYERGVYHVRFRSPQGKGSGTLTPRECALGSSERTSPEAYDKVAARVIGFLRAKGFRGIGEVRRVFQAPCPLPVRGLR